MEQIVYDRQSFLDKVYRKAKSLKSRQGAECALNIFDAFCLASFAKPSGVMIQSIKHGSFDLYRLLDSFVSYLDKSGITANSIHTYMSWVRNYMVYSDVEVSELKFRHRVSIPKKKQKPSLLRFRDIQASIYSITY